MNQTFSVLQGDAQQVIANYFGPNQFHACLCDPPYGYTAYGVQRAENRWDTKGVPPPELWEEVHRVLRPGAILTAATGDRTYHRVATNIEDAGFEIIHMFIWMYTAGMPKHVKTGARLKPALEPYVIAQKRRDGTIKHNQRRWGCGTFNLEGCRVSGHVPSNLALDDGAAALLDILSSRAPSSFFFTPGKAPPSERGKGNNHPTLKPLSLCEYLARLLLPKNGGDIIVPFSGAGSEMIGALRAGWSNVVGVEREGKYVKTAYRRIPEMTRARPRPVEMAA